MAKARSLMIQGTHSDAGKSALVTAFCRIFAQDGYEVAPFKSQNMALNSYITADGKEIGRAQGVQAEAAGTEATTDMNPILLKPTGEQSSQVVVHGKPYETMAAGGYREHFFETGKQLIGEAYERLSAAYDHIVIEGAGSPAEINLNDRELVNMRVAEIADAPVILVGDIEKGGVFASLVGTLQLLKPHERERVAGVMINKFRGDVSLLEPGLKWFEEYTGIPVLGVIPHIDNLRIEAEDSVVLDRYTAQADPTKAIDIAVIRLPRISNFTDADPFFDEPDCHVRFVSQVAELGEPDLLILPGSKSTLLDLTFLQENGLAERIAELAQAKRTTVVGICGGYQMLGRTLRDPFSVESDLQYAEGLGLLPLETSMRKEKTTVRSEGTINFQDEDIPVSGYEIHMGDSQLEEGARPLIRLSDRSEGAADTETDVFGTYFHGLFHNDCFRESFLNVLRAKKGLAPIRGRQSFAAQREEAFDELAAVVRTHCDLQKIYQMMGTEKVGEDK